MRISGRNTEQPRVKWLYSRISVQLNVGLLIKEEVQRVPVWSRLKVKRDAESCLVRNSGVGALLPPQKRQNLKSDLRYEMRRCLGATHLLDSIAWTSPYIPALAAAAAVSIQDCRGCF